MSKPVICAPNSVNLPECNDCVVDCESFAQYQRDQERVIQSLTDALNGKMDANRDAILDALGYEEIEISMTDTDGEIVGVKVLGRRIVYPYITNLVLNGAKLKSAFQPTVNEYNGTVTSTEGSVVFDAPESFRTLISVNGTEVQEGETFEWVAGMNSVAIVLFEGEETEPSNAYHFSITNFPLDVLNLTVTGNQTAGSLDPTFDKNTIEYQWVDGDGTEANIHVEASVNANIHCYYSNLSDVITEWTDVTQSNKTVPYEGKEMRLTVLIYGEGSELTVDSANEVVVLDGVTYNLSDFEQGNLPDGLYAYGIQFPQKK